MSDSDKLGSTDDSSRREQELKHLADMAIRMGERLTRIAEAAKGVVLDPTVPMTPSIEQLKRRLSEANLLDSPGLRSGDGSGNRIAVDDRRRKTSRTRHNRTATKP